MRDLNELIERARRHVMTPAEKEAQRQSFAYGNAAIDNPSITRAGISEAARRLADQSKA